MWTFLLVSLALLQSTCTPKEIIFDSIIELEHSIDMSTLNEQISTLRNYTMKIKLNQKTFVSKMIDNLEKTLDLAIKDITKFNSRKKRSAPIINLGFLGEAIGLGSYNEHMNNLKRIRTLEKNINIMDNEVTNFVKAVSNNTMILNNWMKERENDATTSTNVLYLITEYILLIKNLNSMALILEDIVTKGSLNKPSRLGTPPGYILRILEQHSINEDTYNFYKVHILDIYKMNIAETFIDNAEITQTLRIPRIKKAFICEQRNNTLLTCGKRLVNLNELKPTFKLQNYNLYHTRPCFYDPNLIYNCITHNGTTFFLEPKSSTMLPCFSQNIAITENHSVNNMTELSIPIHTQFQCKGVLVPKVHNFMTKDSILFSNTSTLLSPRNVDFLMLKKVNQTTHELKDPAETLQPTTAYILSLIHSPLIMTILLAIICYAIFKLKNNIHTKKKPTNSTSNNTNIINIDSGTSNSSSIAETQNIELPASELSYNE